MTTIAKSDAAARFEELMERTARGEMFEITENGRPFVRLSPLADVDADDRADAIKAAQELIAMTGVGGRMTADQRKSLVEEGRRY